MTRYERNPSVEVRPDGDGAIALHTGTREYFELNASARFLWDQLDGGATADALVDRVIAAFDVEADEARPMVIELLEHLVAEGLLLHDGTRVRRRDRVWRRLFGARSNRR